MPDSNPRLLITYPADEQHWVGSTHCLFPTKPLPQGGSGLGERGVWGGTAQLHGPPWLHARCEKGKGLQGGLLCNLLQQQASRRHCSRRSMGLEGQLRSLFHGFQHGVVGVVIGSFPHLLASRTSQCHSMPVWVLTKGLLRSVQLQRFEQALSG